MRPLEERHRGQRPGSGTRVDISITEDDGPNLVHFAFREPAMRERMDDIVSALQQATS